jgi:flagellar assembly factor FliW
MVKGNHFQFNSESLFYFLKTIYGFENFKSFSGFKLFILARTFVRIHYRRALEFVGSLNLPPKVLEFWYPIAEIWQTKF